MSQTAKPAKPPTPRREGKEEARRQREDEVERNLDEALDKTFPASDPIAVCAERDEPVRKAGGDKASGGKAGGKSESG